MPAADVGRGAEQRPLMVGGTSFDVDGSSSRQNARFLKSKYNYRWTHGICNSAVLILKNRPPPASFSFIFGLFK